MQTELTFILFMLLICSIAVLYLYLIARSNRYEIEQLEDLKGIVDKIADNEKQLKDDTTAKLYVDIATRRNGIEKVGFYKYLDLDTIQLIKYALNKCIDNRITLNKKLIDETNYVKINK